MRQIGVIGLGRFGSSVAKTLSEKGAQVIGVDLNQDVIQDAQEYLTQAVQADATDEKALRAVGIDQVDVAIVGVGEKLEASILITLNLKQIGIKEVIARAVTENHGEVLQRVGATKVIFPERDMGARLANSLIFPKILEHIELSSDYSLLEMIPPREFIGKTLGELDIRAKYGLNVIVIKKTSAKGERKISLSPSAETVIKQDDILVAIGKSKDIEEVKKKK